MSYEYYEEARCWWYYGEASLENKFFEYKADFAAKGYAENDAEEAAANALDKFMEDCFHAGVLKRPHWISS